jgi:hypothetical protein
VTFLHRHAASLFLFVSAVAVEAALILSRGSL